MQEPNTARKAILMGVVLPHAPLSCEPLTELTKLAETDGIQVVGTILQNRPEPHSGTYLGKGKVQELKQAIDELKADLVICDDDLSPSQSKGLEKILNTKVMDRTDLILDIFAAHARTREAKMQVELAKLQYALPRLQHMWEHLDRYAGGYGERGPGEKQLELDRRSLRDKIHDMSETLAEMHRQKTKDIHKRRETFLTVALVGYTSAGKSTLMNALTHADALVEGKLFCTLDTRTRNWEVVKGRNVLLSDTVGFIEKLPHHLVASFQATLEEAAQADLLLHVVDVAHPAAARHIAVVRQVLESIQLHEKPMLLVFNKVDAVAKQADLHQLETLYPDHVAISAKFGTNLAAFSQKVLEMLEANMIEIRVAVPMTAGKLLAWVEANAHIIEKSIQEQEIRYVMKLSNPQATWFMQQESVKSL